jgi:hypothetical protein
VALHSCLLYCLQFNPCLTLLGINKPMPTLKLFFNQTLTNNNVALPMKLT